MILTALRKLFGFEDRLAKRVQLRTRFRPRLEVLEDRTLLSGDPLTWSVQSDYFGTRDGVSEPRSLRGLALSSDNQNLYGGFIQGTTSAAIREVSSGINTSLIGNDGGSPSNSYGANPPYTTGLEDEVTTYDQPKGLATDDRGNVYAALNSGTNLLTQQWTIYKSDLSAPIVSEMSTNYTSTSQLSGIATAKIDGDYYVYIGWKNGQIERWNVDNAADPILDTSWGSAAHPGTISLKTINGNAYLNGLTVDSNGDIYVAGGLQGTTAYGDSLIKITAAEAASGDLTAATHVDVKGGADGMGGYAAMDVALFNGQAYVTEYLGADSTIAVFNTSDLSSVDTITPTNPTGPSGLDANFTSDASGDSGFSDIDISKDGQIYVAEQLYNYVAPADSYTPPGGVSMTGTRIYFDRIMVSSAQPVAPAITSADNTTFTVGTPGSFTVTTTGAPVSSLSESGDLPDGVTFVDNGDGTATLSGTPAVGSYQFTIIASNDTSPEATQLFTLTDDEAPTITSANNTTFTVGTAGSFTVTTGASFPANAALAETGTLPSGVTFVDNGDGTATLSGTPAIGSGGTYQFTITAANDVLPDATQLFTLTDNEAPSITSSNSTTFTVGTAGSFTVTTGASFPANAALTETGTLPSGVTFVDNHDGTATLSGVSTAGSGGSYSFLITASNGVSPNATQLFTLTNNETPTITSANNTTFTVGTAGNFTVATGHSFPANVTLTETGTLPSGVTFVDNHNGTATFSGTPAAGSNGTYTFTITAANGVNPNATQTFALTVNSAPLSPADIQAQFQQALQYTFTMWVAVLTGDTSLYAATLAGYDSLSVPAQQEYTRLLDNIFHVLASGQAQNYRAGLDVFLVAGGLLTHNPLYIAYGWLDYQAIGSSTS